jgi:hypothetical protein
VYISAEAARIPINTNTPTITSTIFNALLPPEELGGTADGG